MNGYIAVVYYGVNGYIAVVYYGVNGYIYCAAIFDASWDDCYLKCMMYLHFELMHSHNTSPDRYKAIQSKITN